MTSTLDAVAAPDPTAAFGHRLVPAGDPLAGATFEAIYDSKIKPELIKCEAERQGALKTFILTICAGGLLIFLEFLLTHWFVPSLRQPPDFVVVLTAILAFVFGYLPLQRVARTAKKGVIESLCDPLNVTYALSGDAAPAFDTFLRLKLLPHYDTKSFEDFFSGRRGNVDFALCEGTLVEGSGKERHTVFHGQLFRLTMPRERLSTTVVLRNSGWFNRFECPPGMKAVGLEDPVFNKAFAVFGSDQVEAREILTPAFMQRLVDLETAYTGAHLRYAFTDSDLLIAVEGKDRFEIGGMFSTLVSHARVEGIARDLEQVFKLIDDVQGG